MLCIIFGILIIFLVESDIIFFLNGRFWMIWGLVIKFRKCVSFFCGIIIFVCGFCDGIGVFFLWRRICCLVII